MSEDVKDVDELDIDELLSKYRRRFHKPFPTCCVETVREAEEAIRKCLKSGNSYEYEMVDKLDFEGMLSEYRRRFHEPFPIFYVSMTAEEQEEALKKCLKSNTQYEYEIDPNLIYRRQRVI